MSALVIKIGGRLLHSEKHMAAFFSVLQQLSENYNCVLVHGGGDIAQEWLTQLGLTSEKVRGVRITPNAHLPYVVGALAGYVNTRICAIAKANGINVVGLNLGDGGICKALEKAPELGAVGDVVPGKAALLKQLLANDYVPVLSSIATAEDGQIFNVNADDAAAGIAQLLSAPLVLLSDVPGVLDHDNILLTELNEEQINVLCDTGVIHGGMVVKVEAAQRVANKTGQPVIIASWKTPETLLGFTNGQPVGTAVQPSSQE